MDQLQRDILLGVARDAVRSAIMGGAVRKVESEDAQLNVKRGCFVTLKNGGELRGCLGQFSSDIALIELIGIMAASSATQDPRFINNRITEKELYSLDIEISVLSELVKTDDPMSLRLGVDGIYIKKGSSSGCFLPQVAIESNWGKEQFLSICCSHKAGISPDAWKSADTDVYLFSAEAFHKKYSEIK